MKGINTQRYRTNTASEVCVSVCGYGTGALIILLARWIWYLTQAGANAKMSAESLTLYVQKSNNQSIHTSTGIHQPLVYYEEKHQS